jgi:peroxiredoxin
MSQPPLTVGQPAPDFRLKGPDGQFVTLSEFRGQRPVMLVFFPLAFSPVCSHQLPGLQRDLARFEALGAAVFGVSVDSHYSNSAFARSLGLGFPLLSDFKRAAMTAYGVLRSEAGYSERASFLIGRDGLIAWREISADIGDIEQIPSNEAALAALAALAAPR